MPASADGTYFTSPYHCQLADGGIKNAALSFASSASLKLPSLQQLSTNLSIRVTPFIVPTSQPPLPPPPLLRFLSVLCFCSRCRWQENSNYSRLPSRPWLDSIRDRESNTCTISAWQLHHYKIISKSCSISLWSLDSSVKTKWEQSSIHVILVSLLTMLCLPFARLFLSSPFPSSSIKLPTELHPVSDLFFCSFNLQSTREGLMFVSIYLSSIMEWDGVNLPSRK